MSMERLLEGSAVHPAGRSRRGLVAAAVSGLLNLILWSALAHLADRHPEVLPTPIELVRWTPPPVARTPKRLPAAPRPASPQRRPALEAPREPARVRSEARRPTLRASTPTPERAPRAAAPASAPSPAAGNRIPARAAAPGPAIPTDDPPLGVAPRAGGAAPMLDRSRLLAAAPGLGAAPGPAGGASASDAGRGSASGGAPGDSRPEAPPTAGTGRGVGGTVGTGTAGEGRKRPALSADPLPALAPPPAAPAIPSPAAPPPAVPMPRPEPEPTVSSPRPKGPTRDAEATETVDPEIPDSLKRADFRSFVRVRVEVEPDGRFTPVIRSGSGNADIDRRVLEALRKWRWKPALRDGVPVRTTQLFKFEFEVK